MMIKTDVEINYVIKVGNLFLKEIGRKGVEFTTREGEAKHYRFDAEFEKEFPVAKQVQKDADTLFLNGIKEFKVIELKTIVEHSEQEMQFQFMMTPDMSTLRLVPAKITGSIEITNE